MRSDKVVVLIIPVIFLMIDAISSIAFAKSCAGQSIICARTVPFSFSLTPTLDQFYHSPGCRGYRGCGTLHWQPFIRPAITLEIRERGMRRSVTPISHDHIVDPLYMWTQCANGRGKHFALKMFCSEKFPAQSG